MVAASNEAWVERIMDQVDEDLSTAQEEEDDEQVAYDLSEWDDDSCLRLLETLAAETIPYALDGDELLVASGDEVRVDEIVGALTTPGATLTAGGPASFEAMSELFVASDELSHDPDDRSATARAGARGAGGGRCVRSVRHGRRRGGTAWWLGPARWPTSSSHRPPTAIRSSTWPPVSATSCAPTSDPAGDGGTSTSSVSR